MAWTSPPLWVAATTLTASQMNGNIRDNLIQLHDAPSARVHRTTAQAIAAGVTESLSFNSERYDNDTIHDVSTTPQRLTCRTAGVYLITGSVEWDSGGTGGMRTLQIALNSGNLLTSTNIPGAATGAAQHQSVSTLYKLAVGDYVSLDVRTTNDALNINVTANSSPEFAMTWVSTGA